jgi:tetratricopeptide (TPR) repeat protein
VLLKILDIKLQKYYNISLQTPKPSFPAYNSRVSPTSNLRTYLVLPFLVILLVGIILAACGSEQTNNAAAAATPSATVQAYASGSLEQAAESWQAALEANPSDPQANFQMGLILAITSPEEAKPYFDTAQANDPDLTPLIERVTDALRVGELSENPAYRLTLLGQALGAIQEWPLAIDALQLATQQDPNYAEAWAYLGEAQQQTGGNGLESLETALSLESQSYSANLLMALYQRRNGEPGEALDHLLIAEQQDPNNLLLKEDIGTTYAEAGQVEEGLSYLEETAEAHPEQSLAWQILARLSINFDVKVTNVGLPAARQAVLLAEDDPTALLLLGRAYFQNGNISMAERFFSEASILEPLSAEPRYYLGLLYLNQGDHPAAEDHLSQAVQLDPTGINGLQAQKILEQYFNRSK